MYYRELEYSQDVVSLLKHQTENVRADLRKYSFCVRIVNIWSSLPDCVLDTYILDKFKTPHR